MIFFIDTPCLQRLSPQLFVYVGLSLEDCEKNSKRKISRNEEQKTKVVKLSSDPRSSLISNKDARNKFWVNLETQVKLSSRC